MACRTFVLLGGHLIWFHDIFKIIGKDHQCRRVTPSVSREAASRIHEEMCGGASGNDAVRRLVKAASVSVWKRAIERERKN